MNLIRKIIAISIFIISFPLFLLVSLLIIIDSGFPILFKQKRIGVNNKIFTIYKFRTMQIDTPDIPTHLFKNNDSVYTAIGPFLRKYSLDEIPQLINLIRGDMTFIGPRPALYNQDDLIQLRTEARIHRLIPGVTGWAQVNGLRGATPKPEIMKRRMEFDLWYLNNWTIWLDLYIIFKTFYAILKYKGD